MNKEIEERNAKLINDYLKSKVAKNTIDSYGTILRSLSNFVDKDLMEVEIADISDYFKSIETQAFSTFNLKLICVRDFFNYYMDEDKYDKKNPTRRVKSKPSNKKAKTRALTLDECKALTKLIKNKIKKAKDESEKHLHIRNLAIIELDLSAGFRISELLGLTFNEVDLEKCRITLREDETKGKKERTVNFDKNIFDYLFNYLEIREDILKGKESEYVFVSRNGNMLDRSSFAKILKAYGEEVGIDDISSHMSRSTFITNVYRATGNDIIKTMQYVSHASHITTAKYIDLDNDKDELIKLPTARL